jgi:diaminopimelate epimerase
VHLTKHHGLGNDFLVVLGDVEPTPAMARLLCDRRRGVGADGLIAGQPRDEAGVDVRMVLHNSDGSRAAMSGNGIRCLAQAVVRARGDRAGSLTIATDAGIRTVDVVPGPDPATCLAHVDMGPARPGPAWTWPLPEGLAADTAVGHARLATVDVGNPHLVLLVDDPDAVDLARHGSALETTPPGGTNVEFIAPRAGHRDEIDLVVWERGAGRTEACGTGASAAAWAAHGWGLVGSDVIVHLPGGDVRVRLGLSITLSGPATFVARVEVDLDDRGATAGPARVTAAVGGAATGIAAEGHAGAGSNSGARAAGGASAVACPLEGKQPAAAGAVAPGARSGFDGDDASAPGAGPAPESGAARHG